MAHRHLAYIEYGDPDGLPVIYCHGFPSSCREAQFLHRVAGEGGARVISPDRPGYGRSDFQPRRTILSSARDVSVLTDDLGLERFALLGVSGGGPYALACAYSFPERIAGCALVCPLGPLYLQPILAKMNRAARINFNLARHAPLLSRILLGPSTARMLFTWPNIVRRLRTFNASSADIAELANPQTKRLLDQTVSDAMRNGARGTRQDLSLYIRDWGFPLHEIDVPMDIWHGEEDGIVPVSHTAWYAAHMKNARIHYVPNEGHYSLPMRHSDEILRTLIAQASPDLQVGM